MKRKPILILLLLGLLSATLAQGQIVLKPSDVEGESGAELEVPIMISGSRGAGPMQFIVDFDHRVLEAIADPPGVPPRGVTFGKLVSGGMISQVAGAGELRIAVTTNEAINTDGELLTLRFKVKGKAGASSVLSIDMAEVWDMESLASIAVRTESGKVTITGAGASGLPFPLPIMIAVAAGAVLLLLLLILVVRKKPAAVPRARPVAATTAQPGVVPPPPGAVPSGEDTMVGIQKLKEMFEADLISAEDFERKKQDLLDRM